MSTVTIAVLAAALLLGGVVAWLLLRRRPDPVAEDEYAQALERWLAGDLEEARALLQRIVQRHPQAYEPFLQLGNLLRALDDPGRAAALHRGLSLRRDLTVSQRLTVQLALAEDLVAAGQWQEAASVLEQLRSLRGRSERYWILLFRQRVGAGEEEGAARVLQEAAARGPREHQQTFRRRHALFQMDRALRAARAGDAGLARRLVRPFRDDADVRPWALYAEALAAEQMGDHEKAVAAATTGMHDAPAWSDLYLPILQSALLATGRYERVVPILESASRAPDAPPSLWIAQAMLHEKVGQRELAVRLLEEKAADPRLTPALAAPLLRILVQDLPDCDFTRVWSALHLPEALHVWRCRACDARYDQVRLFCPRCQAVGEIVPVTGEAVPAP